MADTCCSAGLGEVYFCSLNQAFINDPEIDEIDIISCIQCHEEQGNEEQSPVIVVLHKLGIKSWCVKHLYLFAYKKLLQCQQKDKSDLTVTVTDSLQLTRAVLIFNSECYTAWNVRKELISTGVLRLADDMKFSSLVLSKHPRSAESFAHRRWTIIQLIRYKGEDFFNQSCLRTELVTTLQCAEKYADNYIAWSHRVWLVERFIRDRKKKLLCELQMMKKWTEMHISDNCGFHYRQVLIKLLQRICPRAEVLQMVFEELEFTNDLIFTFPGHEVIWYHRRFLYHFWNQQSSDITTEKIFEVVNAINFFKESNSSQIDGMNKDSMRTRQGRIPSLAELAGSAYHLLKTLNPSSISFPFGSESLPDCLQKVAWCPLSVASELEFCCTVINQCGKGPDTELQRRCASNYKQWLLFSSKACQVDKTKIRSAINKDCNS